MTKIEKTSHHQCNNVSSKHLNNHIIGLGSHTAQINVYIENRPPIAPYQQLSYLQALVAGDVASIAQQTGNHWRKIFNVYAKLLFELQPKKFDSWQTLREQYLLQSNSNNALLFNKPTLTDNAEDTIHIVMGKTYAAKLATTTHCYWLSEYFAFDEQQNIIVCPYFDYRQLSNIKITQLAKLISSTITLRNDELLVLAEG